MTTADLAKTGSTPTLRSFAHLDSLMLIGCIGRLDLFLPAPDPLQLGSLSLLKSSACCGSSSLVLDLGHFGSPALLQCLCHPGSALLLTSAARLDFSLFMLSHIYTDPLLFPQCPRMFGSHNAFV